jgi:glycosyltransferase involved in cell wall biosynthesis
MDSPRCSFFLPNLDGGGAELVLLRLAQGFADRGITTDLVLANATGPYMNRVPAGVRVVDLRARPPVVVSKTLALGGYLRRERPEVLVAGLDIVSSSTTARALSRRPTRVVMSVQTNLSRQFEDKPRGARIRKALVRALYGRADRLVAVSRGTAADLARISGLPRERISVIYNPVVPPDLDALVAEPPDHPWLTGEGPPVVLGIGRLVRQKDFPTLVRAFGAVRRERPARLVILGSPDPREPEVPAEIERLIDDEGIRGDVALPGFKDNPYAYLARASVFALSSAYEGFGNVVAEALATGTAVVSTDCESGPGEILDRGRFGRLVPVGNHAALARAILETLEAPPERALLRSRAEAFRSDVIVDQYLDVAGLASPGARRRAP